MGNNNVLIAVIVVAIIAIVGWLAYKQGYFGGMKSASPTPTNRIQINY